MSKSRIKRLRGLKQPQYRLRVGDIRVFYDIFGQRVEVLAIVPGKPTGLLVGFATEDDWFDYRLENDPRFLERISAARSSLRAGKNKSSKKLKVSPSYVDALCARVPGLGC